MSTTTKKISKEVLELPEVQQLIHALRFSKITLAALMNPKTDIDNQDIEEAYVVVAETLTIV